MIGTSGKTLKEAWDDVPSAAIALFWDARLKQIIPVIPREGEPDTVAVSRITQDHNYTGPVHYRS